MRSARSGRRTRWRAGRVCARPDLSAPLGLVATRLDLGDDQLAILEWPVAPPSGRVALSRAEGEVLALLLLGLSNAEIAARRGRSARTVASQVAAILGKLGVRSRLELLSAR